MMMANPLIITQFLVLLVFLLGCAHIIKFHWGRREMYRLASKLKNGLPSYPIIGSAHYFLGPSREIQNKINKRMDKCWPSFFKGWIGTALYVCTSKPEHLEIILNHKDCINKGENYVYLEMLFGRGLVTENGAVWRKNRKAIQPSFNQKILNQFVPIFAKSSEILVNVLKKFAGKGTFDVYLPMSNCTLDSILETGIGVKADTQTTNFPYAKWLIHIFDVVSTRMVYLPFHFDFIFNLSSQGRAYPKSFKKLSHFTKEVIREKREAFKKKQNTLYFNDDGRQKAFLDLLIELENEGTNFTDQQIFDEVQTMIAAATDTSATTLSFLLIMLGMYPDVQQKLYEEVIDVIGEDRSVTVDDFPQLKYMDLCVKEILRLFPSIPHFFRQTSKNIELEGTIIPANTNLYISILHAHRNEHIWTDPLKFDPERFLPEEFAKKHPYSYIPFSVGPRSCIGRKYGIMQIKTILATTIRKYKISTPYKNVEEIETTSDIVLRTKKGFKISVEEREKC